MIYPDVSLEAWAAKYNLPVGPDTCRNCGKQITPTIPYADGKYRGLKTEPHGCPPGYDHYVFQSTNENLKETVNRLFLAFSHGESPS